MISENSELCGLCKIENPCSCRCHDTNLIHTYHEEIYCIPLDRTRLQKIRSFFVKLFQLRVYRI